MAPALQHPYLRFEGTKEWVALDAAVTALVVNGDLLEQTHRAYIVGSLCKALADVGIMKTTEAQG